MANKCDWCGADTTKHQVNDNVFSMKKFCSEKCKSEYKKSKGK